MKAERKHGVKTKPQGVASAGAERVRAERGRDALKTPELSVDRMWQACIACDKTMDGRFVMAVKTTGIFCKASCRARKPLRQNVEFFSDVSAALHAGYRACKRCEPLLGRSAAAAPAWVQELLGQVDTHPGQRVREQDLRERGLEPSTVRRWFQSHMGMTFHAYARSRRVGGAMRAIRAGVPMTQATLEAGFRSESGIREAMTRMMGDSSKASIAGAELLHARWLETPLGPMLAVADEGALRVLDFVDRRGLERHLQQIVKGKKRMIVPVAKGESFVLDEVERELTLYFAGRGWLGHDGRGALGSGKIELRPVPEGSEFQRQVWAELRRIPLGETRSYAAQAKSMGKAAAVRAVARANGENFLGLVIPCHRVIGSDGKLVGYGGGVSRKRWLLEHEAAMAAGGTGRA